jgi:hypothetical protein
MSEEYDDTGKIALWKHVSPTNNSAAPAAKGHFFAHRDIKKGEKIMISLWKEAPSENANAPVMKGKIQDKYVPSQSSGVITESSEDIPF